MQAVDRMLLFVLGFLSMLAVTPLWADSPERSADATVVSVVEATPETATNVVNTDHTITATAMDSISQTPLEGFDVTLEVLTGPNAAHTDLGVTDVNGQVTFTYTGAGGPGDDSIQVCLFFAQGLGNGMPKLGLVPLDCDTVAKTWITPTPTATATPAPTATAPSTPTPTATPAATTAPAQLPGTGGDGGGSSLPWVALGLSTFVALTLVTAATVLKRAR